MHFFTEEKKRFLTFCDSLFMVDDDYLLDIKDAAIKDDVPIITDECASLLRCILNIKKPKRILELGTAVGYSALLMSKTLSYKASIDTVENYKPRIKKAKENLKKYDKHKTINLYHMEIDDFLDNATKEKLIKRYDIIFLDAAKAQYVVWLPLMLKLLKKGGLIIADNVLLDKDIYESRYTIRKRDRSIHKRMHEYLYEISHDDRLLSYLYDIGDGVSITIKR